MDLDTREGDGTPAGGRRMAAGGEFVEGWLVAQVLGEGAYGEVRLLVHARSGARVALKAVGGTEGAREAALHRALKHTHVIRCLGARAHGDMQYLFLEYAEGGELFERIEPDCGMAGGAARRYWRQLAAGLRYLHARGVAHRDIKPENLLLTGRDTLKISDFGMATLYRHGSRERRLSRVCGTLPYAAAEVHAAPQSPYRAAPADTWAAAVVMLAMLIGELPWERAHPSDARYSSWRSGDTSVGVWRRLDAPALRWFKRALAPEPSRRALLADLLLDSWMHDAPPAPGARGCLSQPAGVGGGGGGGADPAEGDEEEVDSAGRALQAADMDAMLSCSQPATTDLLLLSPDVMQESSAMNESTAPVRRLARIWIRGSEAEALRTVCETAERACGGWTWKRISTRVLKLECGGVGMRVTVAGASGMALLQCARAGGCGLQFQRRFRELCEALQPHIVPAPAPKTHLPPLVTNNVSTPMDEDPS